MATVDATAAQDAHHSAGPGHSPMGLAALLVSLAAFSFGPSLSSRATTHPIVSTAVRMSIAAVLHWFIVIAIRRVPDRALLRAAIAPGVLFSLNNVLFFGALQHASVANATLLVSLQPIVVLLLAKPLFGEPVPAWDVAWTVVALSGVAFAIRSANASSSTKQTTILGVVLASISMLAYTGYFLLAKRANSQPGSTPPHPLAYMTAVLTASSITAFPFVVGTGRFGQVVHISRANAIAILWLAVVIGFGHVTMSFVHRSVSASLSSLLLLLQPITAAFAAWWLLGQHILVSQLLGGVVVIGSIAMVMARRWRAGRVTTGDLVEEVAVP